MDSYNQIGIIEVLQRSPVPQTRNWTGTFFAVSYSKPALELGFADLYRKENRSSNRQPIKDGLISDSFSLWLESPKLVLNHSPEHFLPKEKMLMGLIWHQFLI